MKLQRIMVCSKFNRTQPKHPYILASRMCHWDTGRDIASNSNRFRPSSLSCSCSLFFPLSWVLFPSFLSFPFLPSFLPLLFFLPSSTAIASSSLFLCFFLLFLVGNFCSCLFSHLLFSSPFVWLEFFSSLPSPPFLSILTRLELFSYLPPLFSFSYFPPSIEGPLLFPSSLPATFSLYPSSLAGREGRACLSPSSKISSFIFWSHILHHEKKKSHPHIFSYISYQSEKR